MGTCNFWKFFIHYANFWFSEAHLNNKQSKFDVYCKSLVILKEIKNTGKFLRVWAKNQLRFEIFLENFKINIRKSQWEIDSLPIFSPIFQNLWQFIQLWKITPFSTTIFSVSGGGVESSPSPCGPPCPSKITSFFFKKFFRFIEFKPLTPCVRPPAKQCHRNFFDLSGFGNRYNIPNEVN